jgi:hypothetical protein
MHDFPREGKLVYDEKNLAFHDLGFSVDSRFLILAVFVVTPLVRREFLPFTI